MGYRLHYATKYDVAFAGGYFNCQPEDVNQFLMELGLFAQDDSFTVFDIAKEEFKAKVDELRPEYTSKANEPHPLIQKNTYGTVLEILDEIISGTTGNCIHLEWY